MAKAEEYLAAKERCLTLAEQCVPDDVRRAWLAAADSYDLLLKLDRYVYEGAMMNPPLSVS